MCVRDRDRSPPPPPPRNVEDVIYGQCPRGEGVCVCACECPRVGVFFNFLEGGWRHADNVQGVCVCACERLHAPPPLRKSCRPIHACNMPSRSVEIKQPPQRRPKLAIHCRVPLSLYCRVSPPPQPGLAVSTSRSCRIHCRVPLPLYCRVPPSLLLGPAVSLQSTNTRTQSLTPWHYTSRPDRYN